MIFPAVIAPPRPPMVNLLLARSLPTRRSILTVGIHLREIVWAILTTLPAIAEIFGRYKNTAIALVIEPDSLPNLVTNIDEQACKDSADGYKAGVAYALKKLNMPHIAMYIDAGHGGWLGWNDNLST
jgi:hypothetical protein